MKLDVMQYFFLEKRMIHIIRFGTLPNFKLHKNNLIVVSFVILFLAQHGLWI